MRRVKKVTVADCGVGNLRSVAKAFERCGAAALVSSEPAAAARAEVLVLPGVGAFGDAARALAASGMAAAVRDFIASGRPFLGICLGLQLLFAESEEALAGPPGLAVFPGRVVRFPSRDAAGNRLKIPHIGWNQVFKAAATPVTTHIRDGQCFYFVHSYYVAPADDALVALWCEYGGLRFCALAARENVYGAQFHPEKSQQEGLALLAAFLEL